MFETISCYSVNIVTVVADRDDTAKTVRADIVVDPLEQFKNATLEKLDGVTCTAHGKRPIIDFHGSSLRDIRISMRCCCGHLSTLANRAIARPLLR